MSPSTPHESIADARRRRERLQAAVGDASLDALILASRANFTYATGYLTPSWAMTARPLTLIVASDLCIAVVGSGEAESIAEATPDTDVCTYTDPVARELNGLTLLDFAPAVTRAIEEVLRGRRLKRIGIEGSVPSASGLPYTALRALEHALDAELVDATPLIWRCRLRKTPFEIARMRAAGETLGRLYDVFQRRGRIGMTGREIHSLLLSAAGEVGADEVGYLTVVVGRDSLGGPPSDSRWRRGELLYVDMGLVVDGYWADFSRHFAAGYATDEQAAAYSLVSAAVRAGRAECQPGTMARDVAAAMAGALPSPARGGLTSIGRIGHGLGLDLTEPPSLMDADCTVLEPLMTLAVEPLAAFPFGIVIAEENLVVTAAGPALLSPPFPPELPIVPE